jgi:hypothetical protein
LASILSADEAFGKYKSPKVEIQNQHTDRTPTTDDADDFTSIAYWYQDNPHPTAL